MITELHFLSVVDAFLAAKNWKDGTLSSYVFNDGKKITQLRNGKSITVTRLNDALRYLSTNWPENAEWPEDVQRPILELKTIPIEEPPS